MKPLQLIQSLTLGQNQNQIWSSDPFGGPVFSPEGDVPHTVDSIPGDATTTSILTPGSYIESAIDTNGDHDWHQITLVAGQTYTFSTVFSSAFPTPS